ncbi:hypothetical protein BH11BAC4_BH11BAC4_24300 [soil metagenome]
METNNHISCYNCRSNDTGHYATAKDVEYFTDNDHYEYYQCNCCKVLFIHPQPLNKLQQIYPSNYYSFNDNSKSVSFKIKNKLDGLFFKKQLSRFSKKDIKVLDIGGGTGANCDIIKRNDNRVTETQVVDMDATAGQTAIQKGHTFFYGKIEDFETTVQYDLILMLNLIEHVADPETVLKKAVSLLNAGGVIIIQTPNYNSLDASIFRRKNWGGYHCPRHWIIFNKTSFMNLAKKCGLMEVHFSYTQGAAFWTVSILHQLQQWKMIKADEKRPLVYHPLFGIISMCTAAFDFIRKPFAPLSQMLIVLKQDEKINS